MNALDTFTDESLINIVFYCYCLTLNISGTMDYKNNGRKG